MAGKDVGASQDNRFFAGGNMEFFAGFIGRKMLLKQGAEPGGFPLGCQDLAVLIDDLYGKPDTFLEGEEHGPEVFLGNYGI